jgi:DNA-binding winged helix-turn-helix (wHTH) protein
LSDIASPRRTYPIGRFTLTPFRQLTDDQLPVVIGLKPLKLLSVLAEAHGAVVTKDELMRAVWPNQIVEENALQAHIVSLRRVLGPYAALLCTCHGLGYRLAATPRARSTPAQPTVGPSKRQTTVALPGALLFALIAGVWLVMDRTGRRAQAI